MGHPQRVCGNVAYEGKGIEIGKRGGGQALQEVRGGSRALGAAGQEEMVGPGRRGVV